MINSDNARDAMGMKLDRVLDLYVDNAVHVTLELLIIMMDRCVEQLERDRSMYNGAPLMIGAKSDCTCHCCLWCFSNRHFHSHHNLRDSKRETSERVEKVWHLTFSGSLH